MIKNPIYRTIEVLGFSLAMISASLSLHDLYYSAKAAKKVYVQKKRSGIEALNESKRYGGAELGTAIGFATLGAVARSRTKGQTNLGKLEAACLAGAIGTSVIGLHNTVQTRNLYAATGVLPALERYNSKEKLIAKEQIPERLLYLGLETAAIGGLLYFVTKKK